MTLANLGKGCDIDVEKLIATRMLINANSGGGKSWAIRRFLEESNGQVQQIVLDLEGEFISLREKYDYLLVGEDGDIPVSIRTAELLARKLLELKVSTIIDLSELKHPQRITFVKRFLDSLVNSPKKLWHPVIIMIDEAHQFCPEKSKSESMGSVIDLMARGRKRGFCGVLATQRISKLHKDAAAECNNQMIGRTGLDIDMKRAGDILGFNSKSDVRSLRNLKAGEFFIYGSAFQHDGVRKIEVGDVKTTHPDRTRGIDIMGSSPTPNNIKKIMKDVVDLPREAEEELRTTTDMKKKIRELKTKLTLLERSKPKPEVSQEHLFTARKRGREEAEHEFVKKARGYEQQIKTLEKKIFDVGKIIGKKIAPIIVTETVMIDKDPHRRAGKQTMNRKIEKAHASEPTEKKLRAGAMRILGWLSGAYPDSMTKQRLATLSGFSVRGGTFGAYVSELKREGWVEGSMNGNLSATKEGFEAVEPKDIPSGEELLNLWKAKFRKGVGKILQYLYELHPNDIGKEDLGYETGFEPTGGTFSAYVSELRRNRLIEINSAGGVNISREFFE